MSDDGPRFNILVDPWIPLEGAGGVVDHGSYVDLLTGVRDAADVVHPRDDMRFFARMLLSALTQALFATATPKELKDRIATPLARDVVQARVDQVRGDFELLGEGAFLQTPVESEEVTTPQLFLDVPSGTRHVLFRPASSPRRLCRACATMALYGAQAFAPSAGRGKSPGVRGAPPTTTLLHLDTVRAAAWANTLSREDVERVGYAPDPARPWRQDRKEQTGDVIGLVSGLFWQPRGLVLAEGEEGPCASCGRGGARVEARGFEARSKVAGGFFRHPLTPSRLRKGKEWLHGHLRADRPAWTGLADMLMTTSGAPSSGDVQYRAAPVVDQWIERLDQTTTRLLVLDYVTDKAKIKGRFVETFSLATQVADLDVVQWLRSLSRRGEVTVLALQRALRRAHSTKRKDKGGFALADAEARLWGASESPFHDALRALQLADADATLVVEAFRGALRKAAFEIFDEATEASSLQNTKQRLIARARKDLVQDLYKDGE